MMHPPSRRLPSKEHLDRKIQTEQVRMLFSALPLMLGMGSLFAVALAILLGSKVGWVYTLSWAGLCALTASFRWVHLVKYGKHRHDMPERVLHQSMWLTGLHGSAWGLAGAWLTPDADMMTISVVVTTLAAGIALATFTHQAHMGSNIAMNIPTLLPAAVMLLMRLDGLGLYGFAGLAFLSVTFLLEGKRSERRIIELLWLRFTTDHIAQERASALKLAQKHSDLKDQFLATMSHEIRTPLNGILGLAQLMEERLPNRAGILGETRQQATLIRQSGRHLLSLINSVLDYSKLEVGQLVIESKPFDLRALVNEVVNLSKVNAASKSLPLYAVLQLPEPCWVEGDAARVRQVLFNLLGNAVKFTESGSITLKVKRCDCKHEPPSKDKPATPCSRKVNFIVEDTGIGVEANQLDRMFQAFTQLESTFSRRVEGTGLGLTISRELARAMKGDVICSSIPGEGSTFTFSADLPACEAASQADEAQAPREEIIRDQLQGHVLVVEDNAVNALVVQTHLDNQGLLVTLASDGQEALRLLSQINHGIDLVLMDCQMPVMDGLEATSLVRAHENKHQCPPVPIIALTANVSPEDIDKCLSCGMNGYLAKPFELQDLNQVLRANLQRQAFIA
jgi:two-component system, sensor histidine kinase